MYFAALLNVTLTACFNISHVDNAFVEFTCHVKDIGVHHLMRNFFHCVNQQTIQHINTMGIYNFNLSMNHFSDLDPSFFLDRYLGFMDERSNLITVAAIPTDIYNTTVSTLSYPNDCDNRDYLTQPIDQGMCQSCFVHAMFSLLSMRYAVEKNIRNFHFSPQHFLSCANMNTCVGGDPGEVLKWITDGNRSLVIQSDLPYTGNVGKCPKHLQTLTLDYLNIDFQVYHYRNYDLIRHYIYERGAVAASMSAWDFHFQFYKFVTSLNLDDISRSGIMDKECVQSEATHLVLIVGFGKTDDGVNYWVVRNTLGTYWGDGGHMLIKAGVNLCRIEENIYII